MAHARRVDGQGGLNDRENQAETESLYSVLPLVALFLAAAES